jgi:hypothetical protein
VATVERTLSSFLESLFDPHMYLSWRGDLSLLQGVLDLEPTAHTLRSSSTSSERALDWSFLQVVEDALAQEYEEVRSYLSIRIIG